jgi:hypothetical protein
MRYATVILSVFVAATLARADGLAADDGVRAQSVSPASATFEYQNDHRALLAKADDWRDPGRPEERRLVAEGAPPALVPGKRVEIPLASVTWGAAVRARVRVSAKDCGAILPALEAKADLPWLAFVADGPGRLEQDGACTFTLAAREPLPHEIREVEGEVQWTLKTGRRRIGLGWSHHALLVTGGPPQPAQAWAMTGVGTVPLRPDHNAVTVYRLRGAIRVAKGASTGTAAAAAAWRYTQKHYDIFANPELNPWALLETAQYGQCMTAGAFIEAVYTILGFRSGKVVYVYPALTRPKNPNLRSSPHAAIPGAFTVEGDAYDVRGQFRRVVADASPAAHKHSTVEAARHRGSHGIERLMFRDWTGHLHNYATAFVVEEGGDKTYFGGGYEGGTYHDAESFLAAACIAVVWVYEEGSSDEWENLCDGADSGYVWKTGEKFRPKSNE